MSNRKLSRKQMEAAECAWVPSLNKDGSPGAAFATKSVTAMPDGTIMHTWRVGGIVLRRGAGLYASSDAAKRAASTAVWVD